MQFSETKQIDWSNANLFLFYLTFVYSNQIILREGIGQLVTIGFYKNDGCKIKENTSTIANHGLQYLMYLAMQHIHAHSYPQHIHSFPIAYVFKLAR